MLFSSILQDAGSQAGSSVPAFPEFRQHALREASMASGVPASVPGTLPLSPLRGPVPFPASEHQWAPGLSPRLLPSLSRAPTDDSTLTVQPDRPAPVPHRLHLPGMCLRGTAFDMGRATCVNGALQCLGRMGCLLLNLGYHSRPLLLNKCVHE